MGVWICINFRITIQVRNSVLLFDAGFISNTNRRTMVRDRNGIFFKLVMCYSCHYLSMIIIVALKPTFDEIDVCGWYEIISFTISSVMHELSIVMIRK